MKRVIIKLDDLLKMSKFPEGATLEDILEKIGRDKVRIVEEKEEETL